MPLLLRRLGRLLRSHGAPRLLTSTQHIQNLFRSLRSGVGLVWVGLLLGVSVGLPRLARLRLIVIAVVIFIVIVFIVVGRRSLRIPRLSLPLSQQLPVERPWGKRVGGTGAESSW